jgi:hypothetical protein
VAVFVSAFVKGLTDYKASKGRKNKFVSLSRRQALHRHLPHRFEPKLEVPPRKTKTRSPKHYLIQSRWRRSSPVQKTNFRLEGIPNARLENMELK